MIVTFTEYFGESDDELNESVYEVMEEDSTDHSGEESETYPVMDRISSDHVIDISK